ncbi:hypothetical protein J6590_090049 [Homalodisca vitripennis]|nr:hypothetical protein J6590_090049 [Homalodisca vitripennis]
MDAECLLLQSALGYIIVISTHTQCARGGDRDIVWRDVLTSNQARCARGGDRDIVWRDVLTSNQVQQVIVTSRDGCRVFAPTIGIRLHYSDIDPHPVCTRWR